MDDERGKEVMRCPLCGCRLPRSENICPQCGNVFHKEDSDWEWKLTHRGDKDKKEAREDKGN